MGYIRKGSIPSLIAGTSVSALYLTAGYLLKNNMEYGIHTALGTSTLLFVAGINRLLTVKGGIRKPVPIMLTVIGGFSTYYYAAKYSEFYR
ncbi:unnamed protein product [Kuraishia capsulata CBS 1993]|uniref:TMEM14 protein n=1 Tax=Kuraishia capsulata CBS 1993 TaxID=1382522 RepID=W6MJC3_9ASCO|nr:uncharacterized protein KUCA_T00002338001 [Kuraishia capsulata CBS 1993]CDK26366.1 unnamed protein product [Kuraishia capsulata CBS 1993]